MLDKGYWQLSMKHKWGRWEGARTANLHMYCTEVYVAVHFSTLSQTCCSCTAIPVLFYSNQISTNLHSGCNLMRMAMVQ